MMDRQCNSQKTKKKGNAKQFSAKSLHRKLTIEQNEPH